MPGLIRVVVAIVLTVATASAGEPIPATKIKTISGLYSLGIKSLKEQAGFPIDDKLANIPPTTFYSGPGIYGPFWTVLETLAHSQGNVIRIDEKGKTIQVVKSDVKSLSSVDGPFRVVVTGVTARSDLAAGKTTYDVALLIHWEPRFPVFRIDTVPTITEAIDNRIRNLTCQAAKTKSPIGDAYAFSTVVRVVGLTRESKSILSLQGSFVVTASPKMLSFTFDDFTKLPLEKKDSNVSVTLSKFANVSDRWDAEVKLLYPEGHPDFESFESWADNNKLKLISPDRTKSYSPENFSTNGSGRRVTAEYRFLKVKEVKGWTLTYETPAPLTEFTVKFALKDIPLP